MKFLIVISCILAAASAGVIAPPHHATALEAHGGNSAWSSPAVSYPAHAEHISQWSGPQHMPKIGHNGVPVDTHENNARRALHQAAYSEAVTRNGAHDNHDGAQGYGNQGYGNQGYGNQGYAAHAGPLTYAAYTEHIRQWTGPQHLPVIGHNGVPEDTHENNARRAFHHASYAEAVARNGAHDDHDDSQGYDNQGYGNQGYGNQGYGNQGYAAHVTPVAYGAHAEHIYQWTGPQHLPVIGHNGVPKDTHENNARRAFHHAAHAEALSRNGAHAYNYGETQEYSSHATPAVYGAHAEPIHQWTGPQHLPVIGHNGVPVDTKENNARRAFHHGAYAEALSRNVQHTDRHNGGWEYAAHATQVANTQTSSHAHKW